ncbi:MAG: tetratricopeptide repeat protein [Cyanobacteria bacterium P01_A01_bin.105]
MLTLKRPHLALHHHQRLWLGLMSLLVIVPASWQGLEGRLTRQSLYNYEFSLAAYQNREEPIERSIAFYEGRIQQQPDDGLDLAALAGAYLKMAQVTGEESWYLLAEQSAQQSLANLSFNNDGALLVLARVAEATHDFTAALQLSQQADGVEAKAIQVTTLLAMGEVNAAAEIAADLVDQVPSLGSLTLRGLTQVAQGKRAAALADFEQAIAVEEPGDLAGSAWVRTLLGRLYTQQGQHRQAAQLYREALEILPNYPLAHLELAALETRLGRYESAERHYAVVDVPVALHGIARVRTLQGQSVNALWAQAEAALRQHVDENTLGHRRDLAHLLLERGQTEDVERAIALLETESQNRRDAETLHLLAWALTQADRWQAAQAVMQEALGHGLQDAGLFYRAGTIESALGNSSQAERYFQKAKQIDPTFDQQAQRHLGLATQL